MSGRNGVSGDGPTYLVAARPAWSAGASSARCAPTGSGSRARPGSVRARSILGLEVELVEADLGSDVDLSAAMAGVDVAYFLVHMLGSGPDYAAREEVAAARFAAAASEAGVGRIIYLGGLGPDEGGSPHLDSRHHTAEALRELGPPLTYFRAAMIVGPGSESYELLRSIAGKLPALPSPPGCAPTPSRSGSATSSPTSATRPGCPNRRGARSRSAVPT